MFRLILSIFILTLAGCGGGDSATITVVNTKTITISSVGNTAEINEPEQVNLTISGVSNIITINSDINELLVSGTNNLLIFSDGVKVNDCTLSGTDNTTQKSDTLNLNCSDTGLGNTFF